VNVRRDVTDGGQKMIESVPIVEWLDWKYPDKAPRLLPEDINLRYKVLRGFFPSSV
jgi:glutathione S-transferase